MVELLFCFLKEDLSQTGWKEVAVRHGFEP